MKELKQEFKMRNKNGMSSIQNQVSMIIAVATVDVEVDQGIPEGKCVNKNTSFSVKASTGTGPLRMALRHHP